MVPCPPTLIAQRRFELVDVHGQLPARRLQRQERRDPRNEHAAVDRLLDEVVRSGRQRPIPKVVLALTGDDDDWDEGELRHLAQDADHLEAVRCGHVVVQDEAVHRLTGTPRQRVLRGRERMWDSLVAPRAQERSRAF